MINWDQGCQEKYQQPEICICYHPYGRKPFDDSERGESKNWLKIQHAEN